MLNEIRQEHCIYLQLRTLGESITDYYLCQVNTSVLAKMSRSYGYEYTISRKLGGIKIATAEQRPSGSSYSRGGSSGILPDSAY
jgi:hypothetical protein